ncbi:MAG: hypothetical protein QXI97_02255 [Nitrososphaerota archaeon]
MKEFTSFFTIIMLLSSMYVVALYLPHPAAAHIVVLGSDARPSMKEFTIIVTRMGFNGSAELRMEVNQGDTVKITFLYGDHDMKADNPHLIEIEKFDVKVELSREEEKKTVELTINQPGVFSIRCILRCRGHENLQNGVLVVKEIETSIESLRLTLSANENSPSTYLLIARVVMEGEQPVQGVLVEFLDHTPLGYVSIGDTLTNADGIATLEYKPTKAGSRQILAIFRGTSKFKPANATLTITPSAASAPRLPFELSETSVRGENLWPDLRLVGMQAGANTILVILAVYVVMTAWMIVLWTARSILRLRREGMARG